MISSVLSVSAPLDVERIRADFPILQRKVNGRPLIYLDNAATTQKPRQVIDALVDYYTTINANVHRGVHTLSVEATDAYEAARERIGRFVGAEHPEEIVFVRNTTEALNLVADVRRPGPDFLAFSGHKMLGPTGIGALWGRRALLEEMPPFLGGGGMIREVWEDRATWAPLPEKFDAGTPNIADSIALGVAVDYLDDLGMRNVRRHEVEVTGYALERLASVSDVTVYGPLDPQARTG